MNLNTLLFKINHSDLKFLTPYLTKIGFHWNDGLDYEATKREEQRPDKYVLGASPLKKEILQPNGDWTPFWPADERQSGRNVETMSCTFFGLINCIEALAKRKYGENWNKSERFNGAMAGVKKTGFTMSGALDSVRKLHGLVNDAIWPNRIDDITWDEWVKKPSNQAILEGLEWLKEYEVGFEEIPATMAGFTYGLTISPIYCGGYAWASSNGFYKSYGNPNHCFGLKRIDGTNLIAGDTYPPFEKKLASDYHIFWPKIITLNKKSEKSELQKLVEKGVKFIMRPQAKGEVYKIDNGKLVHLETHDEIKNAISLETDVNSDIRELAFNKKLLSVSEEYFSKLNK